MATLSEVGIAGVGNGILMPKIKNRWRITFSGLGSGTMGNEISLQATTCSRPNLSFEEIKLDRYNSTAYVAGKHSWEPCALTVEDDVTNQASKVVQAQLEKQQRLIGATGPWLNSEATASTYKFGTKIDLLDGNELVTESWKLEGCWFVSADFGELDYGASEALTIALSIRFDHARQVLSSGMSGNALGGLILT
jgi:hypothetical protein